MNHTQSYSKNYFALSVATLIIVVVVSSIFILYTNSQREKDNYKILQTESNNISKIISDSFLHHHNLSNFIGQKISQNSSRDSVLSVLSSTDKFNSNSDLMSWTSFSWSDTQNRKMVNSKLGITDDRPINVAERQYVKNKTVITNPWTVQISNPDIGTVSQIWVIPVGMGITDANGKFIGIVTAGFKISEFENKIQQKLSNSNVNFVVIDNDANIILQSSGNITKHDDDFYKRSDLLPKLTEKSGKIKDGIKAYDIYYSHYQKMDNYPYIILTGFNQSFLDKEFNSVILPRVLEIAIIAVILLLILLNLEENLKHSLYLKNEKLNFLTKSINHDLRNYISGIIGLAQEIVEKSNDSKSKECAKMISSQAETMLEFSSSIIKNDTINHGLSDTNFNKIKSEEIDLGEFISELITLKKPSISENKVKVRTKIEKKIPKIKTSYFELRKIIDNIVTNAIKYSKKNGLIVIKVEYRKDTRSAENNFYIEITDQGIGMTKEEISIAMMGKGILIDKSGLGKKIDSHGIGLQIVRQSVNNLGARMAIESTKGKGTTFKLWISNSGPIINV